MGGETKRNQDAENGIIAAVSAGETAASSASSAAAAAAVEDGEEEEEEGKEGLAQCLVQLSGSVPDFPGLEEKAVALLVRGKGGGNCTTAVQ